MQDQTEGNYPINKCYYELKERKQWAGAQEK